MIGINLSIKTSMEGHYYSESESEYESDFEYEDAVSLFHDNQITAAKKVVDAFMLFSYMMLQAMIQSGKTGVSLFIAFEMIKLGKVKNVFIISGMSDTHNKQQWKNDLDSHKREYLNSNFIESYYQDRKRTIEKRIDDIKDNIYFNADLKKLSQIPPKSLIIIDEIHYGSTKNSQLHQVFSKLGYEDILHGKYCSTLIEKKIKILSVSATRAVEDNLYFSETEHNFKENWGRVFMPPGEGYKGINDYYQNNEIYEAREINETNKDFIIEILNKYRGLRKYFVIRVQDKQEHYLNILLNQLNIPSIQFDKDHKDEFYKNEPEQFKIVFIKGKLRLGKQVVKDYIAAVWESSLNSKNDTIEQGLLGRMCGYHNHLVDIYLNKSENEIENLVLEYNMVNQENPEVGLTNTKFVPKRKKTITQCLDGFSATTFNYTIPQIINFQEEDESHAFYQYNCGDTFRKQYVVEILDKLNMNLYTEQQQREINAFKERQRQQIERSESTFRNTHSSDSAQTNYRWNDFYDSWMNKEEFTLFNTSTLIVVVVNRPLASCPEMKPYHLLCYFRLNSPNRHIQRPFMKVKEGEMHTSYMNMVDDNNSNFHETYEYYLEEQIVSFENINNFEDEIKIQLENFENENLDEKKIILRKQDDYINHKIKNVVSGIILNRNMPSLRRLLYNIRINNTKVELIKEDTYKKNNRVLSSQGKYIYKQISLKFSKQNN